MSGGLESSSQTSNWHNAYWRVGDRKHNPGRYSRRLRETIEEIATLGFRGIAAPCAPEFPRDGACVGSRAQRIVVGTVVGAAVVMFVPHAAAIVATIIISVIFGLFLDVPVSFLASRGVRRGLATTLVIVALLGALASFIALLVPELEANLKSLTRLRSGFAATMAARANELASHLPVHVAHVTSSDFKFQRIAHLISSHHMLSGVDQLLAALLVAAAAAMWGVARPEYLAEKLHEFMPDRYRPVVLYLAGQVFSRLRRWLVGQFVISLLTGLSSFFLYWLLGVPVPFVFGILAFTLEVVPTIGVIVAAAGPALYLIAYNPPDVLWLLIGLLAIHQAEDRFLVPTVMGHAVDLPQPLVVLAMFAFGVVWGLPGLFLAIPVTATVTTIAAEVRSQGWKSQSTDRTHLPGPG